MTDYTVGDLSFVGLPIGTSVLRLFCSRGPSAIFGAVWSIVVDAIDRQMRLWSRPHIGIEVFKGLPSFADGDATPPISLPVRTVPVTASLAHTLPEVKFRDNLPDPCKSVGSVKGWQQFCLKTAATLASAVFQCGTVNQAIRFAVAFAQPLASTPSCSFNNEPTSKSPAGYIYGVWHNRIVNMKLRRIND